MCPGSVHDGVLDVLDVVAFLESVGKLDELINNKLIERDQTMTMATRITPNMDGMPHGTGVTDKVGNAAVKLATLAEEINQLIDRYVDRKRQVITLLEKLPAMEYGVLHRYYIQGMTWEEVGRDMGYCDMQVWRYKNKALKHLKDVMECYTIPMV